MSNNSLNLARINHVAGVLGIAIFNCLMIYGLLWNPYTIYFNRPELSHIPYHTRDIIANFITIVHLLGLVAMTIWMLVRLIKMKRFLWIFPAISAISMLAVYFINDDYPSSQYRYIENNHMYYVQIWWLDGKNTYKRFKSEQPYSKEDYSDSIVWDLDSLSKK